MKQAREPLPWQAECLSAINEWSHKTTPAPSVIIAPTGSGKSEVISRAVAMALPMLAPGEVICVVAPSQLLVKQLSSDGLLRYMSPDDVGAYYANRKVIRRVTAVCLDSLPAYLASLHRIGRRVGLLIFDECHWTEGDRAKACLTTMQPRLLLGMTATCFLGDDRLTLSSFDEVLFKLTAERAIREGIIVPPVPVPWVDEDTPADDVVMSWLLDRWDPRQYGPAIVTASDVEDAIAFSKLLNSAGLRTDSASCYDSPQHIKGVLSRLRACELDCAVSVNLLAEGVDVPEATMLVLRKTTSKTGRRRLIQRIGRVLRVCRSPDSDIYLRRFGPKRAGYILDPTNSIKKVGLVHPERLGIEDVVIEIEERDERKETVERLVANEITMASMVPPMDAWIQALHERLVLLGELRPPANAAKAVQARLSFAEDRPDDRQTRELARYGSMACIQQVLPPIHAELFRVAAGGAQISENSANLAIVIGGWAARRLAASVKNRASAKYEVGPIYTPDGAETLCNGRG